MNILRRSSSLYNIWPIAVTLFACLSCFDNNSTGFQIVPALPEAPALNDWPLPGVKDFHSIDTRSGELIEPMNQLRSQSQGVDEPLVNVVDGVRVPSAFFSQDGLQSKWLHRQHNGRRMRLSGRKRRTTETKRRRASRREKQAKGEQSARQGIIPRPVARNIRPRVLIVQRLIPISTTTFPSPPAPFVLLRTEVSCENTQLTIGCPAPNTIRVVAAIYGRKSATICTGPGRPIPDTNCMATNSLSIVQAGCQGLPTCSITANNGGFGGDPCLNTFKYLEVTFFCA